LWILSHRFLLGKRVGTGVNSHHAFSFFVGDSISSGGPRPHQLLVPLFQYRVCQLGSLTVFRVFSPSRSAAMIYRHFDWNGKRMKFIEKKPSTPQSRIGLELRLACVRHIASSPWTSCWAQTQSKNRNAVSLARGKEKRKGSSTADYSSLLVFLAPPLTPSLCHH
jgi:hypothetical protein